MTKPQFTRKIKDNWPWLLWAATTIANVTTSYSAFQMRNSFESQLKNLEIIGLNVGDSLYFIISINILSSLCCLAIAYFYVKTQKRDKVNQYRLNLMSEKLMELQLKERQSIARDIHDDLAQNVAALNLNLHLLKKISPPQNEKQNDAYGSLKACIDRLSRKISHIISELRTPDYSNPNFFETLEELIHEYEMIFGLKIHTYIDIEKGISNQFTRENLYKTIKEALNNVCKHSKANQIKIHIAQENNTLQTIVEDNGVGFLDESKKDTFGLKGMQERVDLMNGHLEINSEAGAGTRVKIAVPL